MARKWKPNGNSKQNFILYVFSILKDCPGWRWLAGLNIIEPDVLFSKYKSEKKSRLLSIKKFFYSQPPWVASTPTSSKRKLPPTRPSLASFPTSLSKTDTTSKSSSRFTPTTTSMRASTARRWNLWPYIWSRYALCNFRRTPISLFRGRSKRRSVRKSVRLLNGLEYIN